MGRPIHKRTRCRTAMAVFITPLILVDWSNSYASLIVNGSFELASVNPGATWSSLPVGNTSIDGWTVTQNTIDYMGIYWVASDGINSIDLDSGIGQAGGIEQTFSTNPGSDYVVSFDMSGNLAGMPTIKPMRVVADGQSKEFQFDITGISVTDMGWENHSWTFTADDNFATLQFLSLNSPAAWGPVIDNVSVIGDPIAQVPEPAILALFGIGIAGIGYRRRQFRQLKKA